MKTLIALVALAAAVQQPPAADDPLAPLQFLVGRWEGTSEGQPGTGQSRREYTRTLGARFIRAENRSTYPPQAGNPKGEVHEDAGYFSYDGGRRRLVLRQFHAEGFVNQYAAEAPSPGGPIVFTSEAIENIPAGWRARETYTHKGGDQVEELFELAAPGKDFEVYSRTRLKRVR